MEIEEVGKQVVDSAIKVVGSLLPIHETQLLTYLRLRNCRLGYLINWHVPLVKDGIKRMVNNL